MTTLAREWRLADHDFVDSDDEVMCARCACERVAHDEQLAELQEEERVVNPDFDPTAADGLVDEV